MLTLNKTKAALQSCQCQNTKLKHPQNSTLIDQVNYGNFPYFRIEVKTGNPRSFVTQYLGIAGVNQSPEFTGDLFPRMQKCILEQNRIGQTLRSPVLASANIKHHSLSASLACLRWRRLISPLAAAMRKPAVLSSDSLTLSINSKSSKGSLTDTCSDLLFLLPVAITESPYVWWCSVCLIKIPNQALTWCSPGNILVVFTLFEMVSKNSEARKCANTNRASNHKRYGD